MCTTRSQAGMAKDGSQLPEQLGTVDTNVEAYSYSIRLKMMRGYLALSFRYNMNVDTFIING